MPKAMREKGNEVFSKLMRSPGPALSSSEIGIAWRPPMQISGKNGSYSFMVPIMQDSSEAGNRILMRLRPSMIRDQWTLGLPGGPFDASSMDPERSARLSLIEQTGFRASCVTQLRGARALGTSFYLGEYLELHYPERMRNGIPQDADVPVILNIKQAAQLCSSSKIEPGPDLHALVTYVWSYHMLRDSER